MAPRWKVPCLLVPACHRSLFKSLPLILALLAAIWRHFHAKIHRKRNLAATVGLVFFRCDVKFLARLGRAAPGLYRCCFGHRLRRQVLSRFPRRYFQTPLPGSLGSSFPRAEKSQTCQTAADVLPQNRVWWPLACPQNLGAEQREFLQRFGRWKRLFVPPGTWQELFGRVPPPQRGKNTQWQPQAARNKSADDRGT